MADMSLADFLKLSNLACRKCGYRQIAQVVTHSLGASHHGKYFTCLNCAQLNFELVHNWSTGGTKHGGFTIPLQKFHRVVQSFPRLNRQFKIPAKCPAEVAEDYSEAAKLLDESPRASAAFSRRCLQNIIQKHGYDQKTLHNQIEALLAEPDPKKALPTYIARTVDAVRNFGNFSAHPIIDLNSAVVVPVEPGEAEWSLQIVEELIDHYYERPELERQRIDELNRKLTAAGKKPILQPKDEEKSGD